ncbi:MAG TPA: Na+/H+ antiporter NhaA [Candidatus Limnocylindrales bacterium]
MATPAFTERSAWARNLAAPLRDFLNTESAGAVALLGAAVAALLWANSPWSDSYDSFWHTQLSIEVGSDGISMDLREWVNQGLMTLFFLVVGLEARREFDVGSLRERRRLILPLMAAIGGMSLAVAIFLAFNGGGDGAGGWGAAMSTDTAFALGVLALVAPGATRLRVRLLTVYVFDDLIALLVIATVYSDAIELVPLAVAIALLVALAALRWAPVAWRAPLATLAAVAMWVALHESGIDPLIAGLAVGLATSAYPPARADLERATELTRSFREQPTPQMARSAQLSVTTAISTNERLQYRLHPWTSFVIVPLFALANAGIHLDGDLIADAASSPITLGILFGYLVGKPVGIAVAIWITSRPWVTGLRPSVSWPVLIGGGAASGIGFTVSLLIASLAFDGQQLEEATLGVLAAAVASTLLSWLVFRMIRRIPANVRARQLAGTADDLLDLSDDVDPERDHIRGPDSAPVTLVEYGDYECPYCGQAEVVIRELLDEFGDELRYVWRHLPLNDVHTHAEMAAEAAEAAAAQGNFWGMHDKLLATQDELTGRDLKRYAEELGLDIERFVDDLHSGVHGDRIADDVASADASGVAGTPSFFINGRHFSGAQPADRFKVLIDEELAKADERIRRGTRLRDYYKTWVIRKGRTRAP